MCGIGGFFGRFDVAALARMNGVMAHRGPDDAGEWISPDRNVGLAHRRLAIIDLSPLGHQPMVDASGTVVIVFNGEIYNFRELRSQLESEGHRFRSHSDTEVLLELYRALGDAMLSLLNGIFAFAIYDQAAQTLFLACDGMGVKPLYFNEGRDGFIFASELKALLACGSVAASLNLPALFRYLGFLWSPGGDTPFNGVCRLGPGEALRIKDRQIVRRWHWADSSWANTPLVIDQAEAIRQVQEGLRTAVQRQMVADVPVGAFLSGGLDSSAVVAMAREVSPNIECFTIDTGTIQDAGVADDLPYARRVAKHLDVKLHEIHVESTRMAADLERMVFQLDEPLADPAPLNVLYISQLARQHGVTVLLSGAGGDDLFTGYRRHRALMLERYWQWLPGVARRYLHNTTSRFDQGSALGRRLTKAFAHAGLPQDDRLVGYFLWADPTRLLGLFVPEHRATLAGVVMAAPLEDYLETLPPGLPPLQRMLALEQRFFLADHNLLYTDKMSMAAGVEVRVPFLDNDLVRLANALPPEFKQRGAEGKWVLKKAMEPYLPHDVIYRPKTGFGAPLRQWLHHELREWVGDILSAETLRRRGLFDPEAVTALVADDRAGRVDAAYTILGLVCVEIWCREFMDKAGSVKQKA
ncbi:MAG: asparagine synthase (glutamine-hydrolyzing) [Gammaproteobacteria bacterium]|nr:asparagine synthase (glutamine-hydrolyzing) [Gammaproteobacteria bacterium]MDH3415321.1 asparagine synthase (glutamine-hydrolyzing) [Gammaproteobacteria bacterium]